MHAVAYLKKKRKFNVFSLNEGKKNMQRAKIAQPYPLMEVKNNKTKE